MDQNKQPRGFKKAKHKAKQLIENREKLKALISAAQLKADKRKEQIKSVWIDFQTLLRLIRAWWNKEYDRIPWKTILYAITAVLYFVNPLDLIPDFIPLTGFIDDITVITFVISSIKKELNEFMIWEQEKKGKE